jgi:hydroxypyruvate reductase
MILLAHDRLEGLAGVVGQFGPVALGSSIGDPIAFCREAGREITVAVVIGGKLFDPVLLENLPNLKAVVAAGVGYDGIDLEIARRRGIAVTNSPGINTDDVADLAMGLLIAGERNLAEADRLLRSGQWAKAQSLPPSPRLRGRVLGIYGLGAIGVAIGKRAEPFGIEVIWHGPREKPDVAWAFVPTLMELAKRSDILMVACPLNDQTARSVDREVLDALGPDGVLINIARGGIVDEPALLSALRDRRIMGAGLDVFAEEPTDPALWRDLTNVVLSPHIAGTTRQSVVDAMTAVMENLRRFHAGEALLNRVA